MEQIYHDELKIPIYISFTYSSSTRQQPFMQVKLGQYINSIISIWGWNMQNSFPFWFFLREPRVVLGNLAWSKAPIIGFMTLIYQGAMDRSTTSSAGDDDFFRRISSWWLNQPIWKNISQIGNVHQIGVNINKYLKPPRRFLAHDEIEG